MLLIQSKRVNRIVIYYRSTNFAFITGLNLNLCGCHNILDGKICQLVLINSQIAVLYWFAQVDLGAAAATRTDGGFSHLGLGAAAATRTVASLTVT